MKASSDVFKNLIKFKPNPELERDQNGDVIRDLETKKQQWRAFEDVYFNSNDNTERDRPMHTLGAPGSFEDAQVSTLLNKERVGGFVTCGLCNKRRGLYKRQNITLNRDKRERVQRCIEETLYTCGSNFCSMEDPNIHKELVVVRRQLQCTTPIERQYYVPSHAPICCHCGIEGEGDGDDALLLPEELLAEWQMVLPMCTRCKDSGKEHITRGKRKSPKLAAQKRKSYAMAPHTPSRTQRSQPGAPKRRRRMSVIMSSDDDDDEEENEMQVCHGPGPCIQRRS